MIQILIDKIVNSIFVKELKMKYTFKYIGTAIKILSITNWFICPFSHKLMLIAYQVLCVVTIQKGTQPLMRPLQGICSIVSKLRLS